MRKVLQCLCTFGIMIVGLSVLLVGCTGNSTPIQVLEYKNLVAFDTLYPADWVTEVPREGLLVFSPLEVLNLGESGPSMTVKRELIESPDETLQEELEHFLEFGPLRGDYSVSSDFIPTTLGEYDALKVSVEREAVDMFIAMKGEITVVQTATGVVYYFIATAPAEEWEISSPQFKAILQNLSFHN